MKIYDLGDIKLQRGATLRSCQLAYKTFGTLNAAKDNVIVYPPGIPASTSTMSGWSRRAGRLIRANTLSSSRTCWAMWLSSSPSNTPEPYNGPRFPLVTACDMCARSIGLVTEKFGISHIRLVTGWFDGPRYRPFTGARSIRT